MFVFKRKYENLKGAFDALAEFSDCEVAFNLKKMNFSEKNVFWMIFFPIP